MKTLIPDYFMNEVVIAGSPETVAREIVELREQVGEFGNIVMVAYDWDDQQQWMTSYELFANEVLPSRKRRHQLILKKAR